MTTENTEKRRTNGMWVLAALLIMLGFADAGLAAKPERDRDVIIPDAERIYSGISTDIVATAEGALWTIPLPEQQALQVLKRSLQRLGIGFTETDGAAPQLLTDWVTWGYDAATNTAHSKRSRLGSAGTAEHHRFRFERARGGTDGSTEFRVTDAARQKKIDIAPDSEYLWLEWRDQALQAGAAFTFGRRMQGEYQAAMLLQPVSVSTRQIASPVTSEPITATAPVPRAIEPAGKIVAPPSQVMPPPLAAIPGPGVSVPARAIEQPTARPVTATGLLVDLPVDATWEALLRALADLQIEYETADRNQLMIVTRWVDADYEKKNQQLHFRSNDDGGWAFDWRGGGPQHHRFQLVLIGDGDKTLVRAYHTGFQEQVDQTPDSSQTLMAWKNRDTDPDIAAALLRRLRIVADR